MPEKKKPHTFKTTLLNDCTNHLAFQLEQFNTEEKVREKKFNSSHETLLTDVVTPEFILGYN
jgi:hypothetical protein